MQNISEEKLLSKLKKGNEKALSVLFSKYWERLFLSAFRVLKDEDTCKDIVQTIFIDLWKRRENLQIKNLEAWLFQSVRFQVARHIRDNKKFFQIGELLENLIITDETCQTIDYNELLECLDDKSGNLPERCRQVFLLSRKDGLSNPQIAAKLQISLSTVENHLNKAFHILKKELSDFIP